MLRLLSSLKSIKYCCSSTRYAEGVDSHVLLSQSKKGIKRTKMINTIGPKTQSVQMAGKLIDQGMNVARLNFSHGSHEQHLEQANCVRQAIKTRPNSHASILLDTKGPQIRTGKNQDGKPVILKRGQLLELTTNYDHLGNSQRIACSYQDLPNSTAVGSKILFADGGVSSIVKNIDKNIVTIQILNDGKLGQKKNMCLPGSVINLPTITQLDKIDIADFGLKHQVHYIAVSFARYKKDLEQLRKMLRQLDPYYGPRVQLISKIQNHQAIHNLQQIIQGSDGIMVARGDLGMEVPLQKVVLLQKYIMDMTINKGKYVVTATQMLQSMQTKPRPTRAQVSDITNACMDMTDALMTSGQTTNGQFPIQCARVMSQIAQQTETVMDYKRFFNYRKTKVKDSQAIAIVSLSYQLQCDIIFLDTDSISLVNRISAMRPRAYICVFTQNQAMKNVTALNFGVYCFPRHLLSNIDEFFESSDYGKKFKLKKANIMNLQTDTKGKIMKLWYDTYSS